MEKDHLPYSEEVYTIRLCVPRLRPTVYSAESWNVGTHHQILQRHVAPRKKNRERVHRKELCKSANLKNAILVPKFAERTCNKKDAPAEKHGTGDKSIWSKTRIKTTFYLPTEAWVMPALFEKARRARIRGRFRSVDAHAEQKGCKLRRSGHPSKHNSSSCKSGRAHELGSTNIRSRSWSLRDGEIARWHACSSIAWKTLRRARLFTWVGQRSKATSDQKWEEDSMQDGKCRAHCGHWDCRQVPALKFVFCIVLKYFFSPASLRRDEEVSGNWCDPL